MGLRKMMNGMQKAGIMLILKSEVILTIKRKKLSMWLRKNLRHIIQVSMICSSLLFFLVFNVCFNLIF